MPEDTTQAGEVATLTSATIVPAEYTGTLSDDADRYASRALVEIGNGHVAIVYRDDQNVAEFNVEDYEDTPRRKRGTSTVTEHRALIEYVNRHKTDGTSLWGDDRTGKIIAVVDDHDPGAGAAGWGQHRITFTARQTPEWLHWIGNNGKWLSQADFSEHIEDGLDEIEIPDAADVLELAQSLQVHRSANFKSHKRLDNGETQFKYEETTTTEAGGTSGQIQVPAELVLSIAPFDRVVPVRMRARFRYRMEQGRLVMGYKLVRPERVVSLAFDDLVNEVGAQTGVSVYAGNPRS